MNIFEDDQMKHKKKSVKKSSKKSDHKHDYEFIKLEEPQWWTHEKVCKICEKVDNLVRIEGGE